MESSATDGARAFALRAELMLHLVANNDAEHGCELMRCPSPARQADDVSTSGDRSKLDMPHHPAMAHHLRGEFYILWEEDKKWRLKKPMKKLMKK